MKRAEAARAAGDILSWRQLVVVATGLLTVCLAAYFVLTPYPEWLFARYVAIPRVEQQYGFRWGDIQVGRRAGGTQEGFLEVAANSRFAAAGVRAEDLLQGGSLSLYHRLAELESGVPVDLLVIQAARYRELLSQRGAAMIGDTEYRPVRISPSRAATRAPDP